MNLKLTLPLRFGWYTFQKTLFIMKLTFLLLTIGFLQIVHADTYGQRITIQEDNISLSELFVKIGAASDYHFIYSEEMLSEAKPMALHVHNQPIEKVLKTYFSNQPLAFTIKNNAVIVKRKSKPKKIVQIQQLNLRGRVLNMDNEPLVGASVAIQGSTRATSTNSQGEFSLEQVSPNDVIAISFLGYKTSEIKASDIPEIIILEDSWQRLSDVEIRVAYGTQNKQSFTGSATLVKSEDLESKPRATFMESMQGKVPGLIATNGSGSPGSFPNMRIRGIGSNQAGNTPLYVVDGIPIITGHLGSLGTSSTAQALINPNDIESVTVLKDAAATSIYGSRAANGVILITTKSGRAGNTVINASAQQGFSQIMAEDRMRPLNTSEMIELLSEGVINNPNINITNQEDALNYLISQGVDPNVNTNWYDLLTRTGRFSQYNVSASGGSEKSTYFTSFGYYDQEGTTVGTDYNRMTAKLNVRNQLAERLKMDLGISLGYQKLGNVRDGNVFVNPIYSMYRLQPWLRAYNDDGTYNPGVNNTFNPLAIMDLNETTSRFYNMKGNLGGTYDFGKGFSFESRANLDYNFGDEFNYENPEFGDARSDNGRGRNYYVRHYTWNVYNMLKYNLEKADYGLDLMLGQEAQRFFRKTGLTYARNYTSPDKHTLSNASTPVTTTTYEYEKAFAAYFFNANVNYQKKYYLSASVRRDGSSVFGANHRFGTFWSVGLAWNLHQEDFAQDWTWLNSLKLRSSYGVNGNEAGGYYPSMGLYAVGQNYNMEPGFGLSQIENANLLWEKNIPFDVGADFSLLGNRISGSIDYYTRTTKDLLLLVPVSRTNGITSYDDNIGSFRNSGLELELTVNPTKASPEQLNWVSSFTFSSLKNEIIALDDDEPIVSGVFRREIGGDYYQLHMIGYAGVNPNNGDALYWTDGTKTATTNSYAEAAPFYQGSALPKYFGSFTNTFDYKRFSLSFQLNYNWGNKLVGGYTNLFTDGSAGISDARALPRLTYNTRWKQPGDDVYSPKIVYRGTQSGLSGEMSSTRFVYDGSYVRLREVSLAYDLPVQKWNTPFNKVSIYFRANNLWTWIRDPYLPRDPEAFVAGGIGASDVPAAKQMIMGIDIQF